MLEIKKLEEELEMIERERAELIQLAYAAKDLVNAMSDIHTGVPAVCYEEFRRVTALLLDINLRGK